jgi:phosphomannomutase/phosphoglucomutase
VSIYKSCDIRGVYGDEWDETDAHRIGFAVGRILFARGQDRIFVGGDFRRSTSSLKTALNDGLLDSGTQVVDVGHAATPIVHHAARCASCRNVAVVTASHNPGKYNGIKLLINGMPALPPLISELQGLLNESAPSNSPGTLQHHNPYADYEAWVGDASSSLIPGYAAAPGLKVVVDAMGGAFTQVASRVLASLGHQVDPIRNQLDPDYETVDPNPANDDNLQLLVDRVLATGADLGLALDGDGDRVIFVDHEGRVVRPEQIAAILVENCFPGCLVVYDLKCASIVEQTVTRFGGGAIRQPSGYGFIRSKLLEREASMGVEASGHHFFRALDGGDDGLFTGLLVLGLVQHKGTPLADLIRPYGWPCITPDIRIPLAGDRAATLELLARTCGGTISRLDGIRSDYDPQGWALARVSITEPGITLRFEGRHPSHVRSIIKRFLAGTPAIYEQVMELINAGTT